MTQVRSFLGLVGYYHRFIEGFSKIAAPSNQLLEKNQPFKWDDECTRAHQELKGLLLQEPVVAYPDFTVPFRLYTDASNIGLGAILAQQQDGRERLICCVSRTLNKAEQNYSATKKECLTVVWGIKNFRNYLIANHFKVYTDHYSLQWLCAMKNESALLHRWMAQLEDYDFEILHRPGKNQGHVDALSRLPQDSIHLLGQGKVNLSTEEETIEVLERIHQDGHLGILKTLRAFHRRFEGTRDKVICQTVVSSCLGCQLGSDYRPRNVPQGQVESTSPWDILSIEVMGPSVSSKKGERYILSIIDYFSKYLILVPLKDHTALTVSKDLCERVIGYFGCPRKILSDRGTEFTGRIWSDLMDLLGVQQVLTSPYYPQGNGIVERSHCTVHNLLQVHLSSQDDDNWVDLLPGVMLTFNEMTQDHHGFTASQFCGGKV